MHIRSFAFVESAASIDMKAARLAGIDGFVMRNTPAELPGIPGTPNRADGFAVAGSKRFPLIDPYTCDSPDQFRKLVSVTVATETARCIRDNEDTVVVFVDEFDGWNSDYLRAFDLGLIDGFASAPPKPPDRPYVSPLGNVVPA